MGGFKDCVAGDVIDISAWSNPDAAYLRRQRVAQIVAVEVKGGNHVEIFRTRQYLLQCDIGDRVLNHNSRAWFSHGNLAPRTTVELLCAKIFPCDLKPPVAKSALGKFHDVALVDQRHALALVLDRVGNRAVN